MRICAAAASSMETRFSTIYRSSAACMEEVNVISIYFRITSPHEFLQPSRSGYRCRRFRHRQRDHRGQSRLLQKVKRRIAENVITFFSAIQICRGVRITSLFTSVLKLSHANNFHLKHILFHKIIERRNMII